MTTLATLFLSLFPFVGAQVFIEPGQTPAQIDSWFSTLEDSGLSTCRIRMFESYMRTPDGWDFSLFDSAIESAERHGIGIWCTLFPATEKTDIGGWKFPYDEAQRKAIRLRRAGCRRGLFGSLRLGREGVLVLMIPSEVKR